MLKKNLNLGLTKVRARAAAVTLKEDTKNY